jgi:beta-fructofuranosidase
MFERPDEWTWDFWLADDGDRFHLFHLKAPRELLDPELRHVNASLGHAVSDDLSQWSLLPDALVPAAQPAFDDRAIWTGSVVRDDSGGWRLFYTGISHVHAQRIQTIGVATSEDLVTWRRPAPSWVLEADPRWYETLEEHGPWPEQAWRDPWVVRDDAGLWHMYITARAGAGAGRGVVGHAVSADLERWEVQPPLSSPGAGFEHLEVLQLVEVENRWVVLFSCLAAEMTDAPPGSGGTWSLAVDGPGTPVDISRARRLTDESLYVGKVIQNRQGKWRFLAFFNTGPDGRFVGGLTDPMPVRWSGDAQSLELG